MHNQQIDYASLVERALLRVVRDVLGMVAEQGLPGRHHLYVTFRTDHAGVRMDDALRARYPNEMTIVLQHEFWALEVSEDRFSVTLKFSGAPHRLDIPIAAVTVFADPSVEFGLQFTRAGETTEERPAQRPLAHVPSVPTAEQPGERGALPGPALVDEPSGTVAEPAAQDADGSADPAARPAKDAEKVVTLDRFRKK